MGKLSDFLAKDGKKAASGYFEGAALDLWWVRDSLDDGANALVYSNGTARSDYKYSGPYIDQQDGNAIKTGWLSIYNDLKLKEDNEFRYFQLYGIERVNGAGILANNDNRNPMCRHFVKLALPGRKGLMNRHGNYYARPNEAAREMDEALDSNRTYQGSSVYINSLSEEDGLSNQSEFESRLAWAIGHELGHLIIKARGTSPFEIGENLNNTMSLMGAPQDTWAINIHEAEIINMDLRGRASINYDQSGNVIP